MAVLPGSNVLSPVHGSYHGLSMTSTKSRYAQMKPWKQYLLLNTVGLVGIVCSIFVVPSNTPLRVWAAISGCILAVLNVALHRRLNRPKIGFVSSVAPFLAIAVLIAEGGWQAIVGYVAIAVAALTGAILWFAKKTIREH